MVEAQRAILSLLEGQGLLNELLTFLSQSDTPIGYDGEQNKYCAATKGVGNCVFILMHVCPILRVAVFPYLSGGKRFPSQGFDSANLPDAIAQ